MLNLSEKQLESMLKGNPALKLNPVSQPARAGVKSTKYHNQKTEVDGILFDSKREAVRYGELKLLERIGEIIDLELQPEFILREGFRKNGKWYRKIVYRADFKYKVAATGEIVVEDSKGYENEVFRIKMKLFEDRYPGLSLRLV